MSFSKEDFLDLTVKGYLLDIEAHKIADFFKLFVYFVNEADNDFIAVASPETATIHTGMKTEICSVYYEEGRVKISSPINENEYSSVGEFTADEEHKILGHACVGILTFCDLFASGTGQKKQRSEKIVNEKPTELKSIFDNNKKYKAWPV